MQRAVTLTFASSDLAEQPVEITPGSQIHFDLRNNTCAVRVRSPSTGLEQTCFPDGDDKLWFSVENANAVHSVIELLSAVSGLKFEPRPSDSPHYLIYEIVP